MDEIIKFKTVYEFDYDLIDELSQPLAHALLRTLSDELRWPLREIENEFASEFNLLTKSPLQLTKSSLQ